MNCARFFAYPLVLMALMFLITPAAAKKQIEPRGAYITQAMIESSQGNRVSIPKLGTFVVKNVSAAGLKNAKCNIDVNSLKDVLQKEFRKSNRTLAQGVVVTVELKMRIAQGEVFCLGGGTGCKVEVVVDQIYENAPM